MLTVEKLSEMRLFGRRAAAAGEPRRSLINGFLIKLI